MSDTMMDLADATAAVTAQLVRSGHMSALEACDAAIERIERLDGPINAVVVRDFERARAAAKTIDRTRQQIDPRPLLGVPITVKESNNVAGLPTTWGIPGFKGNVANADSVAVQRLKAAGAVVLGKTNVSTGLGDWQATNPVYGRTLNPHDLTRSPGGSSGGAAAAIAAGMIPLELGSDIGGSIRIPAHMCGIFGHKPTYGLVPMRGHAFPGTDGVEPPLAVLGPMARSAEDLAIALDVLAGPTEDCPYRLVLPRACPERLSDHRVLVLTEHPVAATDSCIRDALQCLADGLEREGVAAQRGSELLPSLSAAHASYRSMLMAVTSRGVPGAQTISAHEWMNLLDRQKRVTQRWQALFDEVDVVIAPIFGTASFPHQDDPDWGARKLIIDGEEHPYGPQVAWSGLATFAGLPATAVPIARTESHLPIGVQIIGGRFQDHATLAFAKLLQRSGLSC